MHEILRALLYPLPSMVLVSLLVFVHEMGHFAVARLSRVRVATVSIGMGRAVVGRTDRRGTHWKLGVVPFGGYVRMAYETPDAGKGDQRLFEEAPLAVRAAITVAGPTANFGFTVFVFALVFCLWGQRVRTAEITRIIPDTPAEAAGLQPGDRFLTIDGNRIERFDDALDLIHAHPGDRLAVVVQRGAARKTLEITPRILAVPSGDAPTAYESGIGIRYDFRDIYIRRAPLEALLRASRSTTDNIASTLSGLRQLVEHKRPADQVGGIGSFVIVGHKTAANGPEALMWLAGAAVDQHRPVQSFSDPHPGRRPSDVPRLRGADPPQALAPRGGRGDPGRDRRHPVAGAVRRRQRSKAFAPGRAHSPAVLRACSSFGRSTR